MLYSICDCKLFYHIFGIANRYIGKEINQNFRSNLTVQAQSIGAKNRKIPSYTSLWRKGFLLVMCKYVPIEIELQVMI